MGVFSKFKELMGFEEYEEEEEMEVEEDGYKQSGYYDRKPVEPKAPSRHREYRDLIPAMWCLCRAGR